MSAAAIAVVFWYSRQRAPCPSRVWRTAMKGAEAGVPAGRTTPAISYSTTMTSGSLVSWMTVLRTSSSRFTHPEATQRMRESLAGKVTQYAAAQPGDQAELRAALLVAWMLGLTLTRNLLGLGPLRDPPAAEVAPLLRPSFRALIED